MGLAIHITDIRKVRDFLRWLVQPQVAYQWTEADRFFVHSQATKAGGRTKVAYSIHVWLEGAGRDDPVLGRVLGLLDIRATAQLPQDLGGHREYTPSQFLQMWKLCAVRPGRRVRHDLLVAVYDLDTAALGEIFAAAPRNPDRPATMLFLEPRTDAQVEWPCCLIQLPQPETRFRWGLWLEAQNRRFAPEGPRRVQLFYRLPGGVSAEYFVEYGSSHPLPELVDLYPNLAHAHYVLISAGRDRHAPRTQWLEIALDEGDTYFDVRPGNDDAFEVAIEDGVTPVLLKGVAPPEGLRLTPHVAPLSAERRARVETLEKRLQGAKDAVFRLEQQRAALLERQRQRFRILLIFKESHATDGQPPRLSDKFQRFLQLSRRQLEQFAYAWCDGPEGGRHIVLTQDTVFSQDLHVGLADQVYCQPQAWRDWNAGLFLRDNCQLRPQLDRNLAMRLDRSLRSAGIHDDALLLLDPGPDPTRGMTVTALTMPYDSPLNARLAFINCEHPDAELQSRAKAREELIEQLKNVQVDLNDKVEAMEHELRSQATERLDRAQRLWNELAEKIDRYARLYQHGEDELAMVEQVACDFAAGWRPFVDRVLALNQTLTAEKIAALQQLDHEEKEWAETLDAVKRGAEDAAVKLPPLEARVRRRLAEAIVAHRRARGIYASVKKTADAGIAKIARIDGKTGSLIQEMEAVRGEAEKTVADVRSRGDAADALERDLVELRDRLQNHLAAFNVQVKELSRQRRLARRLVDKLEKRSAGADALRADWKKQQAAAQVRQRQLAITHQQTAKEAATIKGQLVDQARKIAQLRRSAELAMESVNDARTQVERDQESLDSAVAQLKEQQQQLGAARARLDETGRKAGDAEVARDSLIDDLCKSAQALRDVLKIVDQARKEELARLVSDFEKTAGDLQKLAAQEVITKPFNRFRRAVEMRNRAAAEIGRFEGLSERQLARRIWAGWQKESQAKDVTR